ncbi:hypothetical protein LCGC14_0306360 [marine sediment metagenome]|uniref:Uncharacterized protein n=1 Tax=marine sediment metagenome TaxID=412755 RepID=A0A0F9U6A3_9ZZZZ
MEEQRILDIKADDITPEKVGQSFFIATMLGKLVESMQNLQIAHQNHLSNHRKSDIISYIQTAIVIICFSVLKWGG